MGEFSDRSQLRISDADRHQVAEVLRDAAGEGRIDFAELDERLEATYAAKVYADLAPIVADLPTTPDAVPQVPRAASSSVVPAARHDHSVAVMSGQKRRGVWGIGATHSAFALMGDVTLDLREAVFEARDVTITATSLMGGVTIVVPADTRVTVEGVGVMGDFVQRRDRVPAQVTADSPHVRVRGLALMGGVSVVRKGPPGEGWRALTRRK